MKTRLSYNCAHLRWTKKTLTIEYFKIVLKKDLGENFLGENFFLVENFCDDGGDRGDGDEGGDWGGGAQWAKITHFGSSRDS